MQPGWPNRNKGLQISMLALVCLCHTAHAESDKTSVSKADEAPSLAFLEYLAELQQVDGKWVSPMDMLDNKESQLQVVHEQQAANDDGQKAEKKNSKSDGKAAVKTQTEKEVKQ